MFGVVWVVVSGVVVVVCVVVDGVVIRLCCVGRIDDGGCGGVGSVCLVLCYLLGVVLVGVVVLVLLLNMNFVVSSR